MVVWSLECSDRRFESRGKHGCSSLVLVVCWTSSDELTTGSDGYYCVCVCVCGVCGMCVCFMPEELETKTLKIFITIFLVAVQGTNPRTQHLRQDLYILNYVSDYLQLLRANAIAVPSWGHDNFLPNSFQLVIHKWRTPEWAVGHTERTVKWPTQHKHILIIINSIHSLQHIGKRLFFFSFYPLLHLILFPPPS